MRRPDASSTTRRSSTTTRTGGRRGSSDDRSPRERQRRRPDLRRLMNKVALVTLWIEPSSHQIVKYTFDNVDFDFLPGAWLVTIDTVKASMTMSQPFPEVWLPKDIDLERRLHTRHRPVHVPPERQLSRLPRSHRHVEGDHPRRRPPAPKALTCSSSRSVVLLGPSSGGRDRHPRAGQRADDGRRDAADWPASRSARRSLRTCPMRSPRA